METPQLVVTEKATKLLEEYFHGKDRCPIRLFVKLGGCGIRSFGIALEPIGKADVVFDVAGFRYIVNRLLLKNVAPILVDSDGFGFRISGRGVAPHHGCGNCGYMCGDGNRCSGNCKTCTLKCGHGLRHQRRDGQRQGE